MSTFIRHAGSRLKYEWTREGGICLLIIALVAAAALNTGNNLLFLILAVLLAGVLMSGLFSGIILSGLEIDLSVPEHVFAGKPTPARLTFRNRKRLFPSYSVTVSFGSPCKHPANASFIHPAAGQCSKPLSKPVHEPYLPHRSAAAENVEIQFPSRGRYQLEGFTVSSKFPFGILRRKRMLAGRCEVVVLPPIEPAGLVPELAAFGAGTAESLQKGRGCDLYGLRDYQPQDSRRYIDWKASARIGHLTVREFTQDEERRITLILDASVGDLSAGTLIQFEKAVSFCAGLAWRLFEDGVPLQFLSQSAHIALRPAAEAIYPVLEALAMIQPEVRSLQGATSLIPWTPEPVQGAPIVFLWPSASSLATHLPADARLVPIDTL
jgi:uncharacterized protein (DUF58 family)